ncbi:MAG: DVUA0089 family protein [Methylovulum sp.]|nr:DVUA0089 family protein [Methylovulum sp.]
MIKKHRFTALKLALLLLSSQSALAADFSFTGNFTQDSDVQLFNFSLAADSSSLIIDTLSLNGGVNAAGTTIASGGFDPYLAIFRETDGQWFYSTEIKNAGDEAFIADSPLFAGNYILALTQTDNFRADDHLSDGFAYALGLTSFASIAFTTNGGGGSGHWAVDIKNVDSADIPPVPTPEALTLTLMGMLGWQLSKKIAKKDRFTRAAS